MRWATGAQSLALAQITRSRAECGIIPRAMSTPLADLHARVKACRRCAEAGYPIVSPPILAGTTGSRIMIVGQAPGRVESVTTHLPFSGPAGKRLFRWLGEAGWDEVQFRATQYMTAVTKCYPGPSGGGRGDRVPTKVERDLCRPWLEQELALVQPATLVPVGGLAIGLFLERAIKLDRVVGHVFFRPSADELLTPWARYHLPTGTALVPLPHPSGASQWLNVPEHQELVERALEHLENL